MPDPHISDELAAPVHSPAGMSITVILSLIGLTVTMVTMIIAGSYFMGGLNFRVENLVTRNEALEGEIRTGGQATAAMDVRVNTLDGRLNRVEAQVGFAITGKPETRK